MLCHTLKHGQSVIGALLRRRDRAYVPFDRLNPSAQRRFNSHDSRDWLQLYKGTLNIPAETHDIGQLSTKNVGETVVLHGYLGPGRRRDVSKKLSFWNISSRANSKHVQIVSFNKENDDDHVASLKRLYLYTQSPVAVRGTIKAKQLPKNSPDTASNWEEHEKVEIDLTEVVPLNAFPPDIPYLETTKFSPTQRHLEIRKGLQLKAALAFRAKTASLCRKFLEEQGFQDVETPILFKSTPEGAREFLVPTRVKGMAYALPQSPQQYKQILMASGIPKYYQIARCFRDEDLRADRQPEFTQLDLEMAFANEESVMNITEMAVRHLWQNMIQYDLPSPFPRITYEEAMTFYGSDKPDRRFGMKIFQISEWMKAESLSKFRLDTSGLLDAFVLPAEISPEFARSWLSSEDGREYLESPDGKPTIIQFDSDWQSTHISPERFDHHLAKKNDLRDGNFLVIQPRQQKRHSGPSTATGRLRLALHKAASDHNKLSKYKPEGFDFLWVTDFPLFSPSNEEDPGQGGQAGLSSTHHPFTAPKTTEDVDLLASNPESAKAAHYDLVVNGVELGGGSRRIHIAAVQEYVLRNVLHMPNNRIEDFRHLLDVLSHGCPPHAGIALGFDRLVAVMLGLESVRDVIAFPKSGSGEDMLVKSPRLLTDAQLETYHLRLKN